MLYIVSTPIGNLEDISIRQARILLTSDIILAEDTRSAQILLDSCNSHFELSITNQESPKIISYYKEKEFEKLPQIISWLEEGKNISLISESGTPLISDPGSLLVKTCVKKNLPFTAIPGPSAIINSLVLSGFDSNEFMFIGFLPKKETQIIKIFKQLQLIKKVYPDITFIFYESPKRINQTLQCFKTLKWNPKIAICREMTKKFEEVLRDDIESLTEKQYKGELTIIIK